MAYATESGDDPPARAGGTDVEKARSVALGEVNGRVTGTEVGDE